MAKHKPKAEPEVVEFPVAPPVVVGPEPTTEPEPAPAPPPAPPPDLTDVKVVHDLRVAGRLWRVRSKAGGPASLVVAETKEAAEAAYHADHPLAGTLRTEKLLP